MKSQKSPGVITDAELDRLSTLLALSIRCKCPKGCDCRRCRKTERFRLTRTILQRLDTGSVVEPGGWVPRIEVGHRDGRVFRWVSLGLTDKAHPRGVVVPEPEPPECTDLHAAAAGDLAPQPIISQAQLRELLHLRVAIDCAMPDEREQACAQIPDERKQTSTIARAVIDGVPVEPGRLRPEIVSESGRRYLRLRLMGVTEDVACDLPLGEPIETDLPEPPVPSRSLVELRLWCASKCKERLSDRDADRAMASVWAAELRFLEERPRRAA